MSESNTKQEKFFGTYFDRDAVLRISRWADIIAWVVLTVYLLTWLSSILLFAAQYTNGLFFDLQGISKILLIMMDMEDNSRRAARK